MKPATGEWTGDTVISYWQPDGTFNSFYKAVADAHNAALAAERENVKEAQEEAFAAYAEVDAIREQLAAERSKVQTLTEALREVNALARGNMTGCGTCNHVIDATIKVL